MPTVGLREMSRERSSVRVGNREQELKSTLLRLVEKVERIESLGKSGGYISAEDWKELRGLTAEARKVMGE